MTNLFFSFLSFFFFFLTTATKILIENRQAKGKEARTIKANVTSKQAANPAKTWGGEGGGGEEGVDDELWITFRIIPRIFLLIIVRAENLLVLVERLGYWGPFHVIPKRRTRKEKLTFYVIQ